MRDAERIEAQADDSQRCEQVNKPVKKRSTGRRGQLAAIAPFQFKPGQSGNPSGRPRKDKAAEIAQEIFEKNPELIYKAYTKALSKGSGFVFQVLSERGYGKLKESLELSGNVSVGERLERAKARRKGQK